MSIEVSKMTKQEILARERFRCPEKGHGSKNGFEHPVCFDRNTKGLFQEKVLFFDIEAEDLSADYGIMFNWFAIDEDGNEFEDYITLDDIKKYKSSHRDIEPREDTRIVKSLVDLMSKYTRVVGHYSCVDPEQRILLGDLTYKKARDIKIGDKLLAFEEKQRKGKRRRYRLSTVTFSKLDKKQKIRFTLSDGTILEVSREHPFLYPSGKANLASWKWQEAKDFEVGDCLTRFVPVYDKEKNNYDYGYLAASVDGEGWLSSEGRGIRMGFSQKKNAMYKEFLALIKKYNFPFCHREKRIDGVQTFSLYNMWNCVKFLGRIQPKRLLVNFHKKLSKDLTVHVPVENRTKIVKIEEIGVGDVMVISTTTHTYISEGFPSHNCGYDLPFARTRAVIDKVDFPGYGMLFQSDTWVILKKKFKLSRNSLENGCRKLVGVTHKDKLSLSIKHGCLRGEKWAINDSRKHCRQDVIDLVALFNLTSKYMRRTKSSI